VDAGLVKSAGVDVDAETASGWHIWRSTTRHPVVVVASNRENRKIGHTRSDRRQAIHDQCPMHVCRSPARDCCCKMPRQQHADNDR